MAERLPCDQAVLRNWMVDYIGSVLSPPDGVPTDSTFDTYGFDSVEAVVMAGVMEEEFGVPVDPIQLFEYPSIDAFSAAFARDGTPLPAAEQPAP
ncbi:acyl carrier protein [Rhodopila sp.]|jgi:acyl carrier protein|uniref:acyl carrier protein n=1 Tax=Rhodopila sp. TaxID=2480087 RepID=UPI002CA83C64|nr:acyl carrier protein [Rhodopila sp.]HVZ10030.1 acyl carrier protein [Rhodopila sp.]